MITHLGTHLDMLRLRRSCDDYDVLTNRQLDIEKQSLEGLGQSISVTMKVNKMTLEESGELKAEAETLVPKCEQSMSTSASLTTLKPLTLWITTNWKIFKEMGIPDHLTCLLRILYASQEASQNQTQNNRVVPNWKRSMSRLYIVTLLI